MQREGFLLKQPKIVDLEFLWTETNAYVIMYVLEIKMVNTNITSFRKNIYSMLEQTIEYNEPINISTKIGNAVVLSEEDYRGMMETLHLESIPTMREKIVEGKNTPLSECVSEKEVKW